MSLCRLVGRPLAFDCQADQTTGFCFHQVLALQPRNREIHCHMTQTKSCCQIDSVASFRGLDNFTDSP